MASYSGYSHCHDTKSYCPPQAACEQEIAVPTMVDLCLLLEARLKITVEAEDLICKDIKCGPCK